MVWASGFRAISDDDFARVVLMQQWAANPQLDPTHSSWLPFPFWVGGAAMAVFGSSLWVARLTALLLSGVSAWLLYRAARLMVGPRGAFAGTFVALWLPWSAYLGVSTVPEMLTAALCVFALATAAPPARGSQPLSPLWGAAALLPACLSRYEAWVVAGCFVLLLLWRQWQADVRPTAAADAPGGDESARKINISTHVYMVRAAAVALALTGPAVWLLYNAWAYDDAFRFAQRVSAYRAALHGSEEGWQLWLRYPSLLLGQEPELALTTAAMALWHWRKPLVVPTSLRPMAWSAGLLLVALTWAAGRGGAATHHSGRALLVVWLLAAIYLGAAARQRLRGPWRTQAAMALAGILALGVLLLRPWFGHFEDHARREGQASFGAAALTAIAARSSGYPTDGHQADGWTPSPAARRSHPGAGAAVLLDAVDYGYFAIQAGSGRPGLWHIDRSLDPRKTQPQSGFSSCRALQESLRRAGKPRYAASARANPPAALGAPLFSEAGWSLYAVPAALGCRE